MTSQFLNQAEIDALLNQEFTPETGEKEKMELTAEERDALGEVANISMGSGATVLSELVNQKVTITNPNVVESSFRDFISGLSSPYLAIKVEYTKGLSGSNLLVISYRDARLLSELMMGMTPEISDDLYKDLDEIQVSAASEAMNQMIASAATAMAQIFERPVDISPPDIKAFQAEDAENIDDSKLVIIKFDLSVGDIFNSQLIQLLPLTTAKEQARLLFETTMGQVSGNVPEDTFVAEENPPQAVPYQPEKIIKQEKRNEETDGKLELILDIPLTVSVILGKTRKPIQDILCFQRGSIVELNRLVDENVDILVNNVLVAKGEVVVINDNFGVKITNILNPQERMLQLRGVV